MRVIHSDVAIIGGGLIGTWTAYFLRQRGHSVAVIEKDVVGSQASGVNFGNVRLAGRHPSEFPLALRAIEQWERLEELVGERCEFSQCGHSYIALDLKELPRLERYQREGSAGGLDIELVGANEVRRRFPWLGPEVCGATWSKRDGTANPRLATPAVARAARALGAEIFPHTRVLALEATSTHFRATTDRDLVFEAPRVVNAAGAWGNDIAAMFGETTPMFPAAPPNFVTEPLPYFITSAIQDVAGAVIIRQVERGNVIVGFYPRGPADRARNRAPVPPAKVLQGLSQMARVAPMLASAQVIRVWAGIEGYLPDMLPVMGWSRTTRNLLHAFGFCGHGFQLSPGVGYTLAEMIDKGKASIPIEAFAIDRFADAQPDAQRLTGEFDAALASAAMDLSANAGLS
ncbi:MAG TPA: FAD-dependent oxidoreductase [Xanthobacteraceae bacterium]|nr:FAD-dependent oxidoreductase [Xanthobacteraceae bacterium]